MPTDFNGHEPDITPTSGKSPLFAAQPVWERASKRKGMFGARKATPTRPIETRTFEETPTFEPEAATITPSTLATEPPLAAPIERPVRTTSVRPRTTGGGLSPAMLAGGVAAVALLGVGGWYMMSPHDGVPVIEPGQTTTSEVAAAPLAPVAQPSEVATATNTLPPRAAAPARAERQIASNTTRVRPAARASAPSASDNSANVSATLPDAPQPYSNPAMPPAAITPAAPAPTESAPPAAVPTTPPVDTAPAETAPPPTEAPPQ